MATISMLTNPNDPELKLGVKINLKKLGGKLDGDT